MLAAATERHPLRRRRRGFGSRRVPAAAREMTDVLDVGCQILNAAGPMLLFGPVLVDQLQWHFDRQARSGRSPRRTLAGAMAEAVDRRVLGPADGDLVYAVCAELADRLADASDADFAVRDVDPVVFAREALTHHARSLTDERRDAFLVHRRQRHLP